MRITFDPRATDDLQRIHRWIANDSPRAAATMIARIEARIRMLEAPGFEYIGRPGLVEGTRELVEAPYLIVYRVLDREGELQVLAIFHGAQNR